MAVDNINVTLTFLLARVFKFIHYTFYRSYPALMFIAIIGSRFSGKSTVQDYLIAKGFAPVQLCNKNVEAGPA